jgi:1-acyl-sn-glycerol-3-phosphate acyltransferase
MKPATPAISSHPTVFQHVFARIWALWALLLFVATMLIAMVFYAACFFLADPAKARWHRNVSRVWMTIYLNAIGCPLRSSGKENYSMQQNYVIVCNHSSLMDVPVSTPFMPRANKTIAKKSFTRVPVFGWIYSFGSVLVDRNSDASRRKSFEDMKAVLQMGLDMVIYPEGTRNRTGQPLKSFYDGAFRLAIDTGKPIMPVVLFNTGKVLPPQHFFFLLPHRLEMHFLPPVSPEGMKTDALKEKVFQQMWDYYLAHQ